MDTIFVDNIQQLLQNPQWGTPHSRIKLRQPVNLRGVVFPEPVYLRQIDFEGKADFRGARFEKGADFLGSRFLEEADFSWTQFTGPAYFWRTHFLGPTHFLQMLVKPSAGSQVGFIAPGEANFSWAFFHGPTDFYRAQFFDMVYFWRTIFCSTVNFSEAKFEGGVHFEGTQHQICIVRDDFKDQSLFNTLLEKRLLTIDQETNTDDYVHFNNISSWMELRNHLTFLSEEQIAEIEQIWEKYARKMFPDVETASLERAYFGNPNKSTFTRINLNNCLVAYSNIGRVNFIETTWDKRPKFLSLSKRFSVRDERNVTTNQNYDAIRNLYYELRSNYESTARYDEAGDFYFGEMEMKRLAQGGILKYFSIIALYKYLSGYCEQYILAITLLVLAVFLIFPAFYITSGVSNGFTNAVVHSLEVTTFLEQSPTVATPLAGRFIEGIQRIIIALQTGLVVLAIKREFERR